MTQDVLAVQTALRRQQPVTDEVFDRLYSSSLRHRSAVHWTPVDVALRVAQLLAASPGGKILDVGAGVGKACLIGALTTDAQWCGVETDARMVRTATRIARELGIEQRATFRHGDASQIDWTPFGGIYLFNPFCEGLYRNALEDPWLRHAAYRGVIATVEGKLASMPAGTRVVTYNGFGGDLPASYELELRDHMRENHVCLWVQQT